MAAEKYRKEEKKKRVRATPRLLLLSTFSFTARNKRNTDVQYLGFFFFFLHKISFKTFFFDTHPVKIKFFCRINVFDLNHMLQ